LLIAARFVDIDPKDSVSREEITRPLAREDHPRPSEVDAVGIPFSNIECEGAGAPTLIWWSFWAQPTGAQQIAVAELQALPADFPCHGELPFW